MKCFSLTLTLSQGTAGPREWTVGGHREAVFGTLTNVSRILMFYHCMILFYFLYAFFNDVAISRFDGILEVFLF